MFKRLLTFIACLACAMCAGTGTACAEEIYYGKGLAGDLLLPESVTEDTPTVMLIHGGGWSGMSRRNMQGFADFLRESGCIVYNVDYRLAGRENPWPACGDDCIAAARFILKGGLKRHGVHPSKLWIAGASAGGHLALWTGLSLPAKKVAGIISVSGIADPYPDLEAHRPRFATLFGEAEPSGRLIESMNPCRLIRKGGPAILLTHAKEDTVVPETSSRNFYLEYCSAGNPISYSQYSSKDEANLGGHCIWRTGIPRSQPRRLISRIENEILHFMGLAAGMDVYSYGGEDFARMFSSGGWTASFLKHGPIFSKVTYLERHMLSDEVFVLMDGGATMYVGENAEAHSLEKGKVYNIKKGTWHQIEVTPDAQVLVIERSGDIRTEKKPL